MQKPDAAIVRPTIWLGIGTICVGMLMAILDVQIVATSLPNIQSAPQIAPVQMIRVQTDYLIAIPLTSMLMQMLTIVLSRLGSGLFAQSGNLSFEGQGACGA